ncbi:MAG: protein kinase [Gemmataceae bacterium]|nr:protein kinase [Gemmata sp.]MDW8199286.1 protein kinase [Gemmataceae bacterium]
MPAPASVDELLQLIRQSGVLSDELLSHYLQQRHQSRPLPDDPRQFADEMINDGLLTHFQVEQYLLGKYRGFTIGKYKLLERIGVGGMGQVFLCEHMHLRTRMAIKVLPPAKADQPSALGRFYREARTAGRLNHPHIVRTHDIDQDGNLHYIVMDYVEGTNLMDIVRKFGPLPIARAVSYIRQAAEGLHYAFLNNIIHRDIKPSNILIDRTGTARILDMGLARFLNDQTDQLTIKYDDKIVLGTADYVAPEQIANSHQVDIRADIYALGGTFYFLLAGHPPFPSGSVSQKLLWHRTKEPTPIQQIRPEVCDGLAAVINKMLCKDPLHRYQTPAEVRDALEPYLTQPVPLPAPEEMPVLCLAAQDRPCRESPPTVTSFGIAASAGTGASSVPAHPPAMTNAPLFSAGLPASWVVSAAQAPRSPTSQHSPPEPLPLPSRTTVQEATVQPMTALRSPVPTCGRSTAIRAILSRWRFSALGLITLFIFIVMIILWK